MKIPPLDFLLVCSGLSLREFELNRQTQAANLRKQIRPIEDELRQAEAEAVLARWLMEYRDVLLAAGHAAAFQATFEFQPFAAMPAGAPPTKIVRRKSRGESRKEICA
jgi:hypothetical protein